MTERRWYCQVCGLPLGVLRDGDLYPMLGGLRLDRHGVAHVVCPKCHAERRWPERAA